MNQSHCTHKQLCYQNGNDENLCLPGTGGMKAAPYPMSCTLRGAGEENTAMNKKLDGAQQSQPPGFLYSIPKIAHENDYIRYSKCM